MGLDHEPADVDSPAGYPSIDFPIAKHYVRGLAHPTRVDTPGGVYVGDGTVAPTELTSGTGLGGLEQIEAGAAQTVTFTDKPTIRIELSADLTLTFAGLAPLVNYRLLFIQDATGGWTVTWPAVSWLGGLQPFINTAPNAWTPVDITSDDGGGSYLGVGAPIEGNSPLAYGILEAYPYGEALIAGSLTTGTVRYTYFTAPTSGTYDTIMTAVGTTAAATITRNEAGVYEVTNAATGALGDRIGTTGHVAAMWATINIGYETPLTAAVDLVAGQRYALAFLCVATTVPLLLQRTTNSNVQVGWSNLHTLMSPKRMAICNSQTDLVADGSGLTLGLSQSAIVWGALKAAT